MKRAYWPVGALLALQSIGCGDAGRAGGTAPRVTAAPPPAVTVSFVEDAVTVAEGATVQISIRYQVNELASPLLLTISPLDQDTAPGDYEFSATSFEIPAGRGTSGTVALSFRALLDEQIAEGDEKMSVRIEQPEGVLARLDQNLDVSITDSGGIPCSGVAVVGTPPEDRELDRWRVHSTTLSLSMAADAAEVVVFDWEGPYYYDGESEWWVGVSPALEVSAAEWEVEALPDATRHAIRVEWEEGRVLRLRFRSSDGTCDRERHRMECRADGCILGGLS